MSLTNDALTQMGGDVMQEVPIGTGTLQIQRPAKGANLCKIKNGCFICDRLFCEGHKYPQQIGLKATATLTQKEGDADE